MKKIVRILILFAIILRLILFFFVEKSLWLDEAALASNVLDKGYLELFSPLQYAQSAPPLFLCFVKIIENIFGQSEKVFRFIPLLCSIASVFGFYFLLNEAFKKNKILICAGLIAFSLSFPLLYNTIEFKPYIVDVLFTIIVSFIWFKYLDNNISLKKQVCFAALLVIFPLFSFGSIFSLAAVLLLSILKKRKVFSIILVSGLLVEYLFIFSKINAGTRVYEYWIPYFINYNPIKAVFILVEMIKYYFYPSNFTLLGFIGFIAGGIILFKKNRKIFNFFCVMILCGFLASFFNFYPLYERLSLFLYPIVLIVILSPLYYAISEDTKVKKTIICILSGIFIFSACFYSFINFNLYKREEIKPLLLKLRTEIKPEDRIFVFKGAHLTYRFYNRAFDFQNKTYICPYNFDNRTCAAEIEPFCNKNRCFIIYSSEIDTANNIKLLEDTVTKLNGKSVLQDKNSILYKIN